MESELSRLLNIQGKKAKLFLANKPYESPSKPFCLRPLSDETGKQKNISLRFTSQLINSDAVLVPYDLSNWYKNKDYIIYLKTLAEKKKLIILNTGDFISKVKNIENAIYLRPFLNPGELSPNTIIIPYSIEPMFTARTFNPEFNISFMGYFPRIVSTRLLYALKNSFWYPVKGNGSVVRRLMAQKIKKTNLPLNLVERNSFSGWRRDESTNTLNRRTEFFNSIRGSRYIMCPRGDGNQSLRFYETLSAGRVPILIDTKIRLPLEDRLNYSEITISLNLYDSFDIWRKKILDFESLYKGAKFEKLSQRISDFYDQNLSMYNFYKSLFIDFLDEG